MWQPITPLDEKWLAYCNPSLPVLVEAWQRQRQRMDAKAIQDFTDRMQRKTSIEAGLIERIYQIDRGITQLLIQQGIEAALIPYGSTDIPAGQVVTIINDHQAAFDAIHDVIGGQRTLTTSFIKQLHQLLLRHQDAVDAVDQFGNHFSAALLKGEWKTTTNNPTRADGLLYEYCPPEHVASQMEQLLDWYHDDEASGVCPELLAAWLHHRFTQIHPFQDGNGRVARYLASLVLIKAGWFPLVVVVDDRDYDKARLNYIRALEAADAGDLLPLLDLFSEAQERAFLQALSLSETIITEGKSIQLVIDAIAERLDKQKATYANGDVADVEAIAKQLVKAIEQRSSDFLLQIFERLSSRLPTLQGQVRTTFLPEDTALFRHQSSFVAEQAGYFANFNGFNAWLNISLTIQDIQTELLFGVHHVGKDLAGVMVVSAIGFRRHRESLTDSSDTTVLMDRPFVFTYKDDLGTTKTRLDTWITDALQAALIYWQQEL